MKNDHYLVDYLSVVTLGTYVVIRLRCSWGEGGGSDLGTQRAGQIQFRPVPTNTSRRSARNVLRDTINWYADQAYLYSTPL